ncbi:hypothetical protein JTB14_036627 [Gonioctena quinquepunctata]|nr:hypothetical protein JTB14_036627 [Gonioctena quinquepunctata]
MSHSLHGVYAPLPQSLSDSDSEKEVSMEPVYANYANGIKSTKINKSFCRHNGHTRLNDEINDIHCIKSIKPNMSALRKTAFIFSILMCFLPIVVLLWILPCSDTHTCPKRIPNWERVEEEIELQGTINLVYGAFENNWNIVLMYKGSFNSPRLSKNGIMSVEGINGAVAWNYQQQTVPLGINCSIIDVDSNGFDDCLVIDEGGLKAIETTGELLWHAHTSEQTSIPELDMPIEIEDFNKDGVNDLLAVFRKETSLVISGKSGLALANIRLPSDCSHLSNLRLTENNAHIRYNCGRYQKPETVNEISMRDLKSLFEEPHTRVDFEKYPDIDNRTFYEAGNRKLLVENLNHCPHCEVPFSLSPTKENLALLKGHLSGFLLKIWFWQDNSRKLPPATRIYKRSTPVHNETYHLNQVSERVLLITLRENDTQIENVSDSDIYLICNGPEHDNCQPDHKNQRNSLLIADLDQDNSLELVSYSSTYEKREEDGHEAWHLISKLKVFRLENELPKLFDNN